jgi:transmembrane sensor
MDKEKYNRIEHFLEDRSFVNWVEETNDDDIAFWEAWLSVHKDKKSLVKDAVAIIKGLRFKPAEMQPEKVETALSILNARIDERLKSSVRTRRMGFTLVFWRVTAGIGLFFISYFLVNSYLKPEEIVHRTAFGEQLDLTLVDGTQVVLNANSTLSYFTGRDREVWLNGEAFFEVEKKMVRPVKFVVHTADLDVEVLGTSFNVNSLQGRTEVMLKEGKVKLNLKNGQEETMEPGELISFSAKENKVLKKEDGVPSELYTAWKDGTLIFKEISLREAMRKIEATYGVVVIFADEALEDKIISVAVPTENLDICINAFQKSMDIEIKKENNQLIIK